MSKNKIEKLKEDLAKLDFSFCTEEVQNKAKDFIKTILNSFDLFCLKREKDQKYYYINSIFEMDSAIEDYQLTDNMRHLIFNYYLANEKELCKRNGETLKVVHKILRIMHFLHQQKVDYKQTFFIYINKEDNLTVGSYPDTLALLKFHSMDQVNIFRNHITNDEIRLFYSIF